tara:strand:+ start:345 stop:1424 length:1080 start_codon:yes stop_codon:yes gene_type:complete
MSDYECQHEPLTRGVYTSESQKSHCCEQCGSKEQLILDERRGEFSCPACGLIVEEKLYDLQNPKTHLNSSEINSGRGFLDSSREKIGTRKDWSGNALKSKDKKKFSKLSKYQENEDRKNFAKDHNKVVERTIYEWRGINSSLSKDNENLWRKNLNNFLSSSEGKNLFISGSRHNAIACALVLESECDKRTFLKRLKIHVKLFKTSKKNEKGIRARGLQIQKILTNQSFSNNQKKREGREKMATVYSHKQSVNPEFLVEYEKDIAKFIDSWWLSKVEALHLDQNKPSEVEVMGLINTVLHNPEILSLAGGEKIESILDACLLISIVKKNPSRKQYEIHDQYKLTPSSRRYHRSLKEYQRI